MSRKRKKAGESASPGTPLSEGVPEDILAEGSGPVQAVARVAMPTDDQEPDPPVRIRKKAKNLGDVAAKPADEEMVHAAIEDLRNSAEAVDQKSKKRPSSGDGESADAAPDDASTEHAVAAPKARKGKRAKSEDAATDESEGKRTTSDAESLAAAAEEAPTSRKGKRKSEDAATDESEEALEAAEEAPTSRKGKRAKSVADESKDAATVEEEAFAAAGEEAAAEPKARKGKRAKSADVTDSEGESIEAAAASEEEPLDAATPAPRKHKRAKSADAESTDVASEPTDESLDVAAGEAVDEAIEAAGEGDAIEPGDQSESAVTAEVVEAAPRSFRKSKRAKSTDASSEATPESLDAGAAVDAESLAATDGDESAEGSSVDASDEVAAASEPSGDEPASLEAADGPEGAAAEGDEEGIAALPTSATDLDADSLKQLVEALVFASDKPMTVQKLRQLTRVSDIPRLEHALFELAEDYADRGIVLQQVSGGYQFRTRTQWSQWVQQLIAGRPVRLTRAQLETLAIVAYRQPITRPEIDEIRGVDSSATLKLLMDRQLIRILGKKEEVGRPMLYGTTKEFLDFFSLGDLRELPTLREYSELTPESRQVITDKLGDLPEDDGSGNGGGMGGDPSGGASADGSELGAAPEEPSAADLIAKYVAELDAESAREQNAERDARDARIEEDERMVFDVLDDELDANTHARGSSPDLDAPVLRTDDGDDAELLASTDDAEAALDPRVEREGDAAEEAVREGDAAVLEGAAADGDALDASALDPDGSERAAALEQVGESIDAPAVASEVVADDAAALAEAILAMAPPNEPLSEDAATPAAVIASAHLANDAAELADAILSSPSITDDLAFDLSDAMTARDGEVAQPELELHEGSLAELDPFTLEREAGAASIGDAFIGESLVADEDRVAIAAVAVEEVEVPAALAAEGDAFVAASILADANQVPVRLSPADEAFVAADVDEVPPAIGAEDASVAETAGDAEPHATAGRASAGELEATADAAIELGSVDADAAGSAGSPPDAPAETSPSSPSSALFADATPQDLDASGSEVARGLFAEGSGGTIGGTSGTIGGTTVALASPGVELDEWPGGSGGVAAARASMDPRPHLDEDHSDRAIRTELVDPDADEVDAVPDPVE